MSVESWAFNIGFTTAGSIPYDDHLPYRSEPRVNHLDQKIPIHSSFNLANYRRTHGIPRQSHCHSSALTESSGSRKRRRETKQEHDKAKWEQFFVCPVENMTIRGIAAQLQLDHRPLLRINKPKYKGLTLDASLMVGTTIVTRQLTLNSTKTRWLDYHTGSPVDPNHPYPLPSLDVNSQASPTESMLLSTTQTQSLPSAGERVVGGGGRGSAEDEKTLITSILNQGRHAKQPVETKKVDPTTAIMRQTISKIRAGGGSGYRMDASVLDPPLRKVKLPSFFGPDSNTDDTARAVEKLGLRTIKQSVLDVGVIAQELMNLDQESAAQICGNDPDDTRHLLSIIYTLHETEASLGKRMRAAQRKTEKLIEARNWGFPANTLVQDKSRGGVVGTVLYVRNRKLFVDYGSERILYTIEKARSDLIPVQISKTTSTSARQQTGSRISSVSSTLRSPIVSAGPPTVTAHQQMGSTYPSTVSAVPPSGSFQGMASALPPGYAYGRLPSIQSLTQNTPNQPTNVSMMNAHTFSNVNNGHLNGFGYGSNPNVPNHMSELEGGRGHPAGLEHAPPSSSSA